MQPENSNNQQNMNQSAPQQPIEPVQQPQNTYSEQAIAQNVPNSNKKKKPIWLIILFIIIALIIVIVLFFGAAFLITYQTTKNAETISNQFVSDIQSDNVNAAYNLTSPAFKQVASKSQLSQVFSQVSPILQGSTNVTGRSISKVAGQPDQATIVYSVKTKQGTKYIRVVMQDNHSWQVLNFRSSDYYLSSTSNN